MSVPARRYEDLPDHLEYVVREEPDGRATIVINAKLSDDERRTAEMEAFRAYRRHWRWKHGLLAAPIAGAGAGLDRAKHAAKRYPAGAALVTGLAGLIIATALVWPNLNHPAVPPPAPAPTARPGPPHGGTPPSQPGPQSGPGQPGSPVVNGTQVDRARRRPVPRRSGIVKAHPNPPTRHRPSQGPLPPVPIPAPPLAPSRSCLLHAQLAASLGLNADIGVLCHRSP